jgi:hypothetical protein
MKALVRLGTATLAQAHADALADASPTGIDFKVVNTAGDAAAELAQLAADCYVPETSP